jgi:hypothetical protein
MKRSLLLCLILLISATAFAADVTGTWLVTLSLTTPDGTMRRDFGLAILQQKGDVITGSLGPDENQQNPIVEGTIKDNKITLKVRPQPDRTMSFDLTVNGEKLVGNVERSGSPDKGTVEFVRKDKK